MPRIIRHLATSAVVALVIGSAAAQSPEPAPVETAAPAPSASPAAAEVRALAASPAAPPPAFALDMAVAIDRLSAKAEPRDRTALQAFYAARQGAPIWVGQAGRTAAGDDVVAEIGRAGAFGLDAGTIGSAALAAPVKAGPRPDQLALDEAEISAAVLRYARHARGGRIDPPSITKFLDRKPILYDGRSVLDQIATAAEPGSYLRDLHPQHAGFQRLLERYLEAQNGQQVVVAPADKGSSTRKGGKGAAATVSGGPASRRRLLANLEQWRWMPPDLGEFYVWVNVPEYTLRVVSNGRIVHSERVIVGKLDTQTPIFSDEMEQVIFHPFWGVPDSIKQNEILPSLKGSGSVLARHNLRIQIGGRDVDPKSVDWSKMDIRKAHVYQPPGGENVLGVVKFRFPNKHDVYMHDTPTKSLFQQSVRAYSHGCMRVQNPVRLAELLLAEDKKMSPERVRAMSVKGAPENNQINLTQKIPVHITYFTASVDDDGKLKTFADVYGHEERVALALEGKAHLIKPVPEPKGPQEASPIASLSEQWSGGASNAGGGHDWARRAFGNN